MAELIEMPKLSDTMSVGTVVSWLKKEGDAVASGDMIAEIETDKATMEMEVFTDGILIKQYVKAGGQVSVGEPIAAIGEKGETAPEVDSSKPEPEASEEPEEKPKEEPKAPQKEVKEPEPKSEPTPEAKEKEPEDDRVKASPLAKKLAKEKGVDLALLSGTGPGGRIVKADVYEAIEKGVTAKSSPSASAQATATKQPIVSGPGIGESASIPVSNMRAVIASRLLQSKTEIPHFYLDIEVDMGPLLAMRKSINSVTGALTPEHGGMKYSVNDFMLKAATEALRRVPKANASWQGKTVEQYGEVHMAFAVAVDEGLVTPVVKNADAKSLTQISLEAKELIVKAQSKKLKPDEMSGSTFTISNLGMYGINSFFGIINPPNAAILSIGATIRKPVVAEDGSIKAGDRMHLGLSCDHRVVDGAVGASYLAALKELIENPSLMLL